MQLTTDTANNLDPLAEALHNRRVAVLTGAGCSTDSGIPDYGGLESRKRRNRIQYQQFAGDPEWRARYWARAAVGWQRVRDARPNPAHTALADLERLGVAVGLITQNVDGLHQRAGSRRVVELHGSLDRVRCLACSATSSRSEMQERIVELNPWIVSRTADFSPDGDAELEGELRGFRVPACTVCSGVLKPDVVFFGENVPREVVELAWRIYEAADVLLVSGSSLAVFSGYRFVLRASREDKPVVIVNDGETRGDPLATLRVSARLGEVLPGLVRSLEPAGGARDGSLSEV